MAKPFGGFGSAVRLWDADRNALHTLDAHDARVVGVAFAGDAERGRLLVSASADKTARVWALALPAAVAPLQTVALAFTPHSLAVWPAPGALKIAAAGDHFGPGGLSVWPSALAGSALSLGDCPHRHGHDRKRHRRSV